MGCLKFLDVGFQWRLTKRMKLVFDLMFLGFCLFYLLVFTVGVLHFLLFGHLPAVQDFGRRVRKTKQKKKPGSGHLAEDQGP